MITSICAPNDRNTDHDLCVFPVLTKLCSNMPHLVPFTLSPYSVPRHLPAMRRNYHTYSCRLFHLGGATARTILRRRGTLSLCGHRSNRLPARRNRASRTPLPSLQEIMPEDQDRTSNKNRRISTNDNATD